MDLPRERSSESPLAMDIAPPRRPRPRTLAGVASYIGAGAFVGLLLILVLGRDGLLGSAKAEELTDPVMHLHARDIGASCWRGVTTDGPARLTVTLEVSLDGRVRYAAAAGETAVLRSCVEAHVKSWEFLPQASAQTMSLPFEVDRR